MRGAGEQAVAGFHTGSGGVADGDSDADASAGGVVEHLDRHRLVVAQPQTAGAGVRCYLVGHLLDGVVELRRVQDLADAVVVDAHTVDSSQGYPSTWVRVAS